MNKIKAGCYVKCVHTVTGRSYPDTIKGEVYKVIRSGFDFVRLDCSRPSFKFDIARFELPPSIDLFPTINKEYFEK